MVKVKICANRSIEDAKMSIDASADIIGILVGQAHSSTDFVDKYTAKEIADYAKGKCDVAVVTHITNAKEIIELTKFIGNNVIQLHSDINENEVGKIKNALPDVKLIRLIHISNTGEILTDYKKMKYSDYYLLDSYNLKTDQVGGTGLTHDWNKSKELISILDKPTFLAGGLNPDNVRDAIRTVKPYGVDVNSGCKNESGKKDKDKVKEFIENAKSVNINNSVIFDLDGTLWEVIESTYNSANIIAKKYNLNEISRETICKVFGLTKEDAAKLYFPNLELNSGINLLNEVSKINIDNLKKNGGNIYPDVKEVLNKLSKSYDLYIVSNTGKIEYIEAFLNSAKVKDCFKDYIASGSLNMNKKDAIEKLIKDNSIEKAVYIGDTIIDLEASEYNNIPFIYAKYGFGNEIKTKYSINGIKELPNILEKVFDKYI